MALVLITGGSSFIGLHTIHQALQQGYRVRTTIRSEAKKSLILAALREYDEAVDASGIEFAHANLLHDDGWQEAVEGATYVLHLASPFPASDPKDENDLIIPARDGTLRVLRAAKQSSSCKRVVVTSSVAAIAYGKKPSNGKSYDERDWTNVDAAGVNAYVKSKTLAEQAAWKFVESDEGRGLELATVNPVGVFGPPMRPEDNSTTCNMIRMILQGKFPVVPHVAFGCVDVRDVAALHLLVMTKPEASGQRYLANGSSRSRTLLEISTALRAGLGAEAAKAPTREVPDWIVRIGAYFSPLLKAAANQLGRDEEISNEKAVALGWKPRSPEEAVVATGQTFIDKRQSRL